VIYLKSKRMPPPGEETLWIDAEFRALLERAGWDRFDVVMAAAEGHCWRAMPHRENWRFDLPDGQGGSCRVYVKKHHVRRWRSWLRARLGQQPPATPARIEMENVARLRQAGVESMRVIALGERFHADGLVESFLITEELQGFLELQFFLPQRFPARHQMITRGRNRDLDCLVRRVAEIARKFHQGGYNHRDLYAGHFFVREPVAGEFEIRLIDLQRVQHRRRFRRRWVLKDLAQLAWSLAADRIGCRDRLAFMRHYLGVSKLRPCDKRLVREVLAWQQRMQRKLGSVEEHSRPFGKTKVQGA
jgi:heptose I phosphotransferase